MEETARPWGYYSKLRPDELATIRAAAPVACVPWAALDWHGPHLPLGTDGIVVETIAEQVIKRTGGVLLPTTWWSIDTMSHAASLPVQRPILRELWHDIFHGLAQGGWHTILVISGHYAPAHELALMEAAEEAIERYDVLVLALPPLALVDETMLDHAALWETSLLLSLSPELVNLPALGTQPLTLEESSVVGRDPRGTASTSLGETAIHMAVEHLVKAVEQLRTGNNTAAPLYALYQQRRTRYRS
jgi:creatinine amidohydrolase